MTVERAIELAEAWAAGRVNELKPGELGEYHAAARDALREKKARRDNAPLTRADLLQMDGKPVWVEYRKDGNGEEPPRFWALVSVDQEFNEIYLQNSIAGSAAYEEAFAEIENIYRHKHE